ncbi:MAG: hypothetical protein MI864_02210 [Pseudomonadales bacterium]|nr:hypothetical protein [Pseudomonadales bacterium]
MSEVVIPNLSITPIFEGVSETWMLATAALAMLISLLEAWLATLIVYGRLDALKKVIVAPHNLIRSHVDYTIMAALLGFTYLVVVWLGIELPKWVIVLLCVGVLYNPFGFLVKAFKPTAGQAETVLGRIAVCAGFLPTTIGFGYVMFAVLVRVI